jgi:type IV pilus assembly protein PilC
MPHYLCKIGTADGRIVERSYHSPSRIHLSATLEDQGFYILSIKRQMLSLFKSGKEQSVRISGQRFLNFNQEFLVLLRSGLPIPQILDALIEEMEAGSLREMVTEVREDVRGGSALSAALGRCPNLFPPLYIAAVRAGEKTGDLPQTLTRFLDYQKRVEEIRSKVRSASFYPLLLTAAALLVVVFLMLFVVPRFTEIYADANVQLPLITRVLMEVSAFVGHFWYLLLVVTIVAVMLLRLVVRTASGKIYRDRLILRLPFWGGLKTDYALSGFSQTLATVLESGVPLVAAMKMACGTLNNSSLEAAMRRGILQVEEGTTMTQALQGTEFFPPLALRMIRVGETSGSLISMLNNIADHYEAEVERSLTRLTTLIEPVLMMTMGLLIAFIIVAMYVPIFELAGTVG